MKILTVDQLRELDDYTIRNEPVSSIDLMERAANACCDWISQRFAKNTAFGIFAGPGNNGGDGLAIARILSEARYPVTVYVDDDSKGSPDYQVNLQRLENIRSVTIESYPAGANALPVGNLVYIDAMFGYGLSREIEGKWAQRVEMLNSMTAPVISIDLPSGLFADEPSGRVVVQADYTLTFQVPKLAFFIPENAPYVGDWEVLDIGLDSGRLAQMETSWFTIDMQEMARIIHVRKKFDHKGLHGHALLVAGSFGKVGAAILASRATLRSGAGLLTIHAPRKACDILQITVPEAMVSADLHDYNFSGIARIPDKITAIGMGCGLGLHGSTTTGLRDLLEKVDFPVVIDADGLNTLSQNRELLELIPDGSILTPHMKEFERLFPGARNHFERLQRLRANARELHLVGVLKGAHSAVALPDGSVWFNTTGNPGMATAGSGMFSRALSQACWLKVTLRIKRQSWEFSFTVLPAILHGKTKVMNHWLPATSLKTWDGHFKEFTTHETTNRTLGCRHECR